MGKLRILFICTLIFAMLFFTQTTHAFWSSHIDGSQSNSQATIMTGAWDQFPILPLDPNTDYEEGDQFIYNDQVWTVVDVGDPVGENETRLFVIIPGQGLVLVAITTGGSGQTIVVRIN
jgi:hypothetical protein